MDCLNSYKQEIERCGDAYCLIYDFYSYGEGNLIKNLLRPGSMIKIEKPKENRTSALEIKAAQPLYQELVPVALTA